jgi:hypothetical protein
MSNARILVVKPYPTEAQRFALLNEKDMKMESQYIGKPSRINMPANDLFVATREDVK